MSEYNLLAVALFVFVMMLIGLGLTIWEFRCGQPHREAQQADEKQKATTHNVSVATARATSD